MDLPSLCNCSRIAFVNCVLAMSLNVVIHTACTAENSFFEIFPSNTTACVGEVAMFTCSTTITESRLFWFVDNKPVNALPLEYRALSTSIRGQYSSLQLFGQEQTNNSEVICAIDPSHKISIFSDPVFLTVVESPPPPTGLTVSTNAFNDTSVLNITWKSENESRETYVIHITDNSTSTRIKQINTTETHVQYNLRELKANYSVDCYNLPSVVFSVSAVHLLLPVEVSCTSEESEAKGIPDVSYILQDCIYSDGKNHGCQHQDYGQRAACMAILIMFLTLVLIL